jgi:hypothetical protein
MKERGIEGEMYTGRIKEEMYTGRIKEEIEAVER